MKKDLEYIFKKIRNIRSKTETMYPEAFKKNISNLEENFDEETEEKIDYQQLESIKDIRNIDSALEATDA